MLEIRVEDFTGCIIAKRRDEDSILREILKKGLKLDTKILRYIDPHDQSTLNRPMTEALIGDIRMIKRTYRQSINEEEVVALEKLEELCIIALSTPYQYLTFEVS